MTYYMVIAVLVLVILAFIPAIIAACKDLHFSKWYIYSLFLFPIALVHSIIIKRSGFIHTIGVLTTDSKNPADRKKKVYKALPIKDQCRRVSPIFICAVFFSKLIFGAFVALSFFALFRTVNSDIAFLRTACINFAIIFSLMLSIVQICGFSRLPVFADEITKRALIISFYSIVCSLPLYLIKEFVLDKSFAKYADFFTFLCAAVSMLVFIRAILRRQRVYYSAFSRFSDYCVLSIASYAIYAAISLILLSMTAVRPYINTVAMPMQVLSLENLGDISYIPDLSYIYSSALAHFFVEIVILLSGLLCRNFKEKEVAARVEYRTTAFRMSRKRILRRHIPNMDMAKIKPLR
ncbi:MAG: hypothetical protein IJD91_03655 [Clostridia bacterium]|nr:hypothetical protein [Clostridia bacterium]